MQCYYHTELPGVGVCTNGCGKTLCRSCAEVYTKLLCPDCAKEVKLKQQQEENQERSESRELMSSAKKALKLYLISTIVFSIYLTYVYYVNSSELWQQWMITGFILGLVSGIKDLRFHDWNIILVIRHIFTATLIGPVIMSILCLFGWTKVVGEI